MSASNLPAGAAGVYVAPCGCEWSGGNWGVCARHAKPHAQHVAPTSFRNCCEDTLIASPNRHESGFATVCACGNIIRRHWAGGWETFTKDRAPWCPECSIPFVDDEPEDVCRGCGQPHVSHARTESDEYCPECRFGRDA